MRYLSLFSGMEAAHLAWAPLGWECVGVAEIEPAACQLLAHRLPGVPNLGSVTEITDERIAALGSIDVVIGGSPCQDLSVAGKRKGLAGARSGLFHEQMRIFHAARHLCGARWLLWENVPGAFSSHKGRDFAVVVGAMAGCDLAAPADGWGSEGVACGEHGLVEWAVLDAQWFGVAQRRRRVFALLDSGDWSSRPPVLLEPESLRGDSAPRREAGQGIAHGAADRAAKRGADGAAGAGTWPAEVASTARCSAPEGERGGLIPEGTYAAETAPTLDASYGRLQGCSGQDAKHGHGHLVAFGGNNTAGPIDVATARNACATSSGRLDFESETFLVQASEGGTGRGTPLVPAATGTLAASGGHAYPGITAQAGDPCHPLTAGGDAPATAFSCKDYGADAGEVSPTLRSMGHDGSHANAGGQVAVAFAQNQRDEVRTMEVAGALAAEPGMKQQTYAMQGMAVRRLTPRECERLQGAEDDWTLVPNKHGKPMADGPRYKMLGNSFAVPVIRWIGQRIDFAMERSV